MIIFFSINSWNWLNIILSLQIDISEKCQENHLNISKYDYNISLRQTEYQTDKEPN